MPKTEIDAYRISRSLNRVPYASWVVQDIALVQQHFRAVLLSKFSLIASWNVDILIRLMNLILNLKITSVLKVRRISNQRWLHPFLYAETPPLAAFNLNSEIFLEIHVPVSVVTIAAYKGLNFPWGVANAWFGCSAWKITSKSVAHLVSQLLAPLFSHLKRWAKVKASFFVGVSVESFLRIFSAKAVDCGFCGLPDM